MTREEESKLMIDIYMSIKNRMVKKVEDSLPKVVHYNNVTFDILDIKEIATPPTYEEMIDFMFWEYEYWFRFRVAQLLEAIDPCNVIIRTQVQISSCKVIDRIAKFDEYKTPNARKRMFK